MKRQSFLIVLVVCVSVWSSRAVAEELDISDCRIVTGFYDLWEKSFFGREPNRVEVAAWIRLNSKLEYEFILWEITPQREKTTWRGGAIPENVLATAHTHPQKDDPKPSIPDVALAGRLGLPIYTISRKGIWKVTPGGAVSQEAGMGWSKALDSCS